MATTPAEAGHIHNEFLRRVDVIAPLSVGDTISTTSMAEIWKSVVDDMVSDGVIEPITLTNSDVYMMLSDIRHWKNTGVCDFTGQSNPDFANWIDYSEEKEYITAAEAADLQRILDDEYFICTIDSMQTDLGKLAIGVRDSSDAFWVQITGRREFARTAADIMGGITGSIWGPVGIMTGYATMSYVMSEAIEMAEAYVECGCVCTGQCCPGDEWPFTWW